MTASKTCQLVRDEHVLHHLTQWSNGAALDMSSKSRCRLEGTACQMSRLNHIRVYTQQWGSVDGKFCVHVLCDWLVLAVLTSYPVLTARADGLLALLD